MTYYSPQLIQTMRDALDVVMTRVPMNSCNAWIKGTLG